MVLTLRFDKIEWTLKQMLKPSAPGFSSTCFSGSHAMQSGKPHD